MHAQQIEDKEDPDDKTALEKFTSAYTTKRNAEGWHVELAAEQEDAPTVAPTVDYSTFRKVELQYYPHGDPKGHHK